MKRRRAAPSEELEALQQRYHDLHVRHQELLDKLAGSLRADLAVHQLGWFALHSVSSALALFRDGFVALANPRWHEVASARRAKSTGWTWLGSDGERRYADLGTLGAAELARLAREADPVTGHCRSA